MHATARTAVGTLVAVVAVAVVAVAVAAWQASPSTSDFDRRTRLTAARPVALSRVSPLLRQAVVTTEDERFYRHHGIDMIGILRAAPFDVAHLSFAQGASTISEQLAKRLYLRGKDRSPWRKLEDAVLALRIEHDHSKDQILGAYLNTAYFGDGATGINSAARRYFGRSAATVDLAQASLLAGLIQAPTADDPTRHPLAARDRQVDVLRSMVRDGDVTSAQATAALARPLALHGAKPLPPLPHAELAPGPPFQWRDGGIGAGLFVLGGAALALRRSFPHRTVGSTVALGLATVALLVLARSFRTL